MIINVASTNPVKIGAVNEVVKLYELFYNAEICSLNVDSGVSEQPISIDEIILGATNRSEFAFKNCEFSFGIESGLMYASSRYFDITACVVFDGENFAAGLSCAFEIPEKIIQKVFDEKVTIGMASCLEGLTSDVEIGKHNGLIGLLTGQRINRKEQAKQAIITALAKFENFKLY